MSDLFLKPLKMFEYSYESSVFSVLPHLINVNAKVIKIEDKYSLKMNKLINTKT